VCRPSPYPGVAPEPFIAVRELRIPPEWYLRCGANQQSVGHTGRSLRHAFEHAGAVEISADPRIGAGTGCRRDRVEHIGRKSAVATEPRPRSCVRILHDEAIVLSDHR